MTTIGSPGREHPATALLRAGSVADLTAALRADLLNHHTTDPRDLMLHMPPYWDAAQRLGASTAEVFEAAADGLPERVADIARTFGRRPGLTLAAMGWRVEETPDGPAYRFAWPRWQPPKPGSAAKA